MDRIARIARRIASGKEVEKVFVGQIWYASIQWKMNDGSRDESVTFYKVTDFDEAKDRIDFAEIGKKRQGGDDEHPLMVPDESTIVKRIDGLRYSVCIRDNGGMPMVVCPAMIALPWDGEPFKETHC